jgi:4-amino-4-deoxy-L-arabinose transferase-like glycosyltransferase
VLRWVLVANAMLLLAGAVLLRIWKLDHIPGLNGDEAWYGVRTLELLEGQPTQWTTPTGNPLNPFYFALLVPIHLVIEPGPVALRLPAAASGLAALLVNAWLAARVFDRRTAIVSTLMLAVLPVNIAYSRFGWDASQTLLATLPVVYAAAALAQRAAPALPSPDEPRARSLRGPRGMLVLGSLALCAAVLVHPTNVFLAPLLVVAAASAYRDRLALLLDPRGAARHWVPAYATLALLLAGVAWLGRHYLAAAAQRTLVGHDVGLFTLQWMRLFTGVTVYQYLAGSCRGTWHDAAGWFDTPLYDHGTLLLAALVVGMTLWSLRAPSARIERTLALGYALCLGAFFFIAGTRGVAPHFERYSLFAIAPGVVLAARACVRLHDRLPSATIAVLLAAGWLLLAGFGANYLHWIEKTGGRSHRAFRTAAVDPKVQALQAVLRAAPLADPAAIVAADFWSYQPLAYLAWKHRQLHVLRADDPQHGAQLPRALDRGAVWFVAWEDAAAPLSAQQYCAAHGCWAMPGPVVHDFAGRKVLSIWQLHAAAPPGGDPPRQGRPVLPESRPAHGAPPPGALPGEGASSIDPKQSPP